MTALRLVCLIVLSLTANVFAHAACLPSVAAADSPQRLSDRGRTLLAGSLGATWSNNERSPGVTRYATWAAWVAPSALYFVRDRLGLGGYLQYEYAAFPGLSFDRHERVLGVGGQSAYEIVLAPRLGILLTLQLGYQRHWRQIAEPTGPGAGRQDTFQQQSPLASPSLAGTVDSVRMGAQAPLVFHLNDSIGIGFGPYFYWDHYFSPNDPYRGGGDNLLRTGVSSWIGGSF